MALIRSLRLVLLLGLAGLVSGIVLSLSANVRGGSPRPIDTGARELPGSARLAQQAFKIVFCHRFLLTLKRISRHKLFYHAVCPTSLSQFIDVMASLSC